MTAKDLMPVAIPHSGVKPEWLEDDAWLKVTGGRRPNNISAGMASWSSDLAYFLLADHWAAPVLRAGLTPWNPLLQGDGPPKGWRTGTWVMLRNLSMVVGHPSVWLHEDRMAQVIGYEATPPAEPAKADLTAVIQEDLPFHVSRSSDGEKEWFSARDPASGVSIPARDRSDAYAMVASLNRAFANYRITREEELSRKLGEAERALERIADAQSAMDGGSIAECRKVAGKALTLIREGR